MSEMARQQQLKNLDGKAWLRAPVRWLSYCDVLYLSKADTNES